MRQSLLDFGFTNNEIEDFLSNALVIQCPKRTALLREGEVPRFLYWATKGIFRAGYTTKEGTEITRAFFTPDTVPVATIYSSFISQTPSFNFVDTIESGELLSWRYDYIKKLENTEFKWLKFMKKYLDDGFVFRDLKEWQFYTMSPEELYLASLKTYSSFINRVPQHYFASYLGMSTEALSRVKRKIQEKNKG